MKPVIIITITFVLLIPTTAYGTEDFSKLDFEVLDVQKFFIPKWINEPGDFSDILQVKFNVTNNGLEYFVVYKNMFQIDVIEPGEQYQEFSRSYYDYRVDNYYPQYIEDFKLRFQDIVLPQSLFECELLNHSLRINQTRTLSVCFDVKQKWSNQPLDLNGNRLYYLVMMDNKFVTSCPNCKSVLLNEYYKNPLTELIHVLKAPIQLPQKLHEILDENDIANLPSWIQKTINWYNQGMISETELINAINYLNTKSSDEIISQVGKQVEKTKLRLNDVKSTRFNGGMPIVFSGNLSTESEFIPNAEILIIGDGPCPANGIISKGLTGKFGRYDISTEAMIWDPSDNMIKIHAEYLGNEIYLPSSSQEEVIVVYPTRDTKSC